MQKFGFQFVVNSRAGRSEDGVRDSSFVREEMALASQKQTQREMRSLFDSVPRTKLDTVKAVYKQ